MALAAVFVAYIGAGVLSHPDWSAAMQGLVVPRMSFGHDETVIVAATVGTTLAPWGLSFIQSYAVDKKLTPKDLAYERTDVVLGAALTGVIGFFVVIACAATLHRGNVQIKQCRGRRSGARTGRGRPGTYVVRHRVDWRGAAGRGDPPVVHCLLNLRFHGV
jgi:Mn2+/Fe2+ NRAMP family transporter